MWKARTLEGALVVFQLSETLFNVCDFILDDDEPSFGYRACVLAIGRDHCAQESRIELEVAAKNFIHIGTSFLPAGGQAPQFGVVGGAPAQQDISP